MCFQHDMVYNAYANSHGRTAPHKVLLDKTIENDSNPKCDHNRRGFSSIV